MRTVIWLLALSVMLGAAGCGGPTNEVVKQVDFDVKKAMTDDLEAIVQAGRLGSGFGHLKSCLPGLTKMDAAKGEAVSKELDELTQLSDPAKVKAKAKKIIEML